MRVHICLTFQDTTSKDASQVTMPRTLVRESKERIVRIKTVKCLMSSMGVYVRVCMCVYTRLELCVGCVCLRVN